MRDFKIYLRALEPADSDIISRWRNDREITDPLGGNTFFVSNYREQEWIKNVIMNDEKNLRLAICLLNENIIGMVNLTSIDLKNGNAEFSILIGEKEYWGSGVGSEATILCIKHGFEELNLHRIYLYVRDDNERAFKLYTKIGFVQEGLLRDAIFKNNKYISMKLMSLLRNEFINY